jgi:hypothetical protein
MFEVTTSNMYVPKVQVKLTPNARQRLTRKVQVMKLLGHSYLCVLENKMK